MTEPLTSTPEDIARWRSAFVDSYADFIIVDGWVGRSAVERVGRAVEDGLLRYDQAGSEARSDAQYTAEVYRPTEKLRALLAQ